MALCAKFNLRFIDGALAKPAANDANYTTHVKLLWKKFNFFYKNLFSILIGMLKQRKKVRVRENNHEHTVYELGFKRDNM